MEEKIELNSNEENETKDNCKCGEKKGKSCSCSGGCSCHSNTIEKAPTELIDLIKTDWLKDSGW